MGDEDTIRKRHERVFYTYGRMNPPTVGHRALIDQLISEAHNADAYVFPTSTHDAPKNPLPVKRKVEILRRMFANRPVRIINTSDCRVIPEDGGPTINGECRRPQDVVERLIQAGYEPENITLLVGEEERVGSFSFLKRRGVTVRAVTRKREVGGISATKVREAAQAMIEGDPTAEDRFRSGINASIPDKNLFSLAEEIVDGMWKPKAAKKRGGGRTRRSKKMRSRRRR